MSTTTFIPFLTESDETEPDTKPPVQMIKPAAMSGPATPCSCTSPLAGLQIVGFIWFIIEVAIMLLLLFALIKFVFS